MDETITNEMGMGAEVLRIFTERMQAYHSEAVKRGMARKAAQGFHMNRVPVGYCRVWKDGRFTIEADHVQAAHIRRAFELAATGEQSMRGLRALMTEEGLCAKSGKPMAESSFHAMLSNPLYAGMIKSGDALVPGRHVALIDRWLFEKVVAPE